MTYTILYYNIYEVVSTHYLHLIVNKKYHALNLLLW